jgi:predicted peroxiredoxin
MQTTLMKQGMVRMYVCMGGGDRMKICEEERIGNVLESVCEVCVCERKKKRVRYTT